MSSSDPSGRYDAVVVGARVAGATTALHLARAGLRVLVVDQHAAGSDTLSTHALMRGGVLQLSRLGLLDEVLAAGTPPLHRTVIRYGTAEEVVPIRPEPGVPALLAPRRSVLDAILVAAATRAGAEVRFRTRMTGLVRDRSGRVVGIEVRHPDGRTSRIGATVTIGADGLRSRVARAAGALTYARGVNASAMVLGYWSGLELDDIQWLYGPGASAGLIPTNDGRLCVWAGTSSTTFDRQRGEVDLGLHRVLRSLAPDWADALGRAEQHGPVRGFPGVRGYLRQPWGLGWALVGDASYFKDPSTTHGMTDALRDAELLAAAVVAASQGRTGLEAALAGYQDTRDRLSHRLLELSDQVAAYDWDMGRLRQLLLDVSTAMRPELEHLRLLAAAPSGSSAG